MTIKDKLETINEGLQTIIYSLILLCAFAMARFLWNIGEQTRVETEIMRIEKGGKK
jgi:hypothetical protein